MNFSQYVDIPFLERGRDRSGCDCWGLLRLVYAEQLGVELPSYLDTYQKTTDSSITRTINQESAKEWINLYPDISDPLQLSKISPRRELPGDAALLRIKGLPLHVAVVGRHNRILHTQIGEDTVYEEYLCRKWEKRILGFYRHASLYRPEEMTPAKA